ncbi:MAG TPA: LLM class flavin-dependent oxidoreductase [Candidatus Dormibacteraeota bacterium]
MAERYRSFVAQRLRFGLCTDQNLPWEKTVERWRLFEELGFDSVWDCDHYLQPSRPEGPYFEAWTLLAGLAAATERIRIGVLVSCNTFRHPYLLAKEAVTVDHVSGGRLEFGLGAGWYEPEHRMLGAPLPEPRELVDRFEEAVKICDGLFREGALNFEGRHYRLRDAALRPLPVQRPRPPFTLGAHKRRMLGIVARYADAWNSFGTEAEIRDRSAILDEECAKIGRDPAEVRRSLYYWVPRADADPWASTDAFEDVIGRYREAGIDEFILDHPSDAQLGVLERVAAEILPRLR